MTSVADTDFASFWELDPDPLRKVGSCGLLEAYNGTVKCLQDNSCGFADHFEVKCWIYIRTPRIWNLLYQHGAHGQRLMQMLWKRSNGGP